MNRMPNISKTSRSIQSAPGQSGTAVGSAGSGKIDACLDDQALETLEIPQDIMDLESRARPAGITQIVGCPHLGKKIKAAPILERLRAGRAVARRAQIVARCRETATC